MVLVTVDFDYLNIITRWTQA